MTIVKAACNFASYKFTPFYIPVKTIMLFCKNKKLLAEAFKIFCNCFEVFYGTHSL